MECVDLLNELTDGAVYKLYSDNKSGFKIGPNLQTFINDAIAHPRKQYLIVSRVNRLTRNPTFIQQMDKMVDAGVHIIFANIRTEYKKATQNPAVFGMILTEIMKGVDYFLACSEQSRKSIAARKANGDYIGGVGFGYKRILKNGKRVLRRNPSELSIIKSILNHYKGGKKPKIIAEILNNSNRLKRNKQWDASMVRRIVQTEKKQIDNLACSMNSL
jgi:DNA invertase Pin-like site-specific DNA recombinase